jgi:hypothetical protein
MDASPPTAYTSAKSSARRMYVKPVETHPGKRRRTKQLNSFYTTDLSIKNHLNETSLIIATQIGAYRYAEKLITQGTDITVSDVLQKTPLHYCVEASLLTTDKNFYYAMM